MQKQYWRFYWPLALMGLTMLVGRQFENGVLSRYEDAAQQLATFAFAMGVYMPFGALLAFVPQMANVLGRSRRGHAVCLRFTMGLSLAITLPIVLAAFTEPGAAAVASIFQLDAPTTRIVVRYLRFLTPLALLSGTQQYHIGMLIQARRTGAVTLLNVAGLAVLIAGLLVGLWCGWPAVRTLAVARLASAGLSLALTLLLYAALYRPPERPEHEDLSYREVMAFFWPVAVTSLMFALSRPILYGFLKRTDDGIIAVAATRVAFDFSMIFGGFVNQFRNLFVTFGGQDLAGVRRFMTRVLIGVIALMAAIVFTPLVDAIFRGPLGIPEDVLRPAVQALRVLCIWPAVMALRNYFHGQLLVRRRTLGMAVGGMLRVAAIYGASWLLQAAGLLDQVWAGAILVLGFAAEAVVAAAFAVRLANGPQPADLAAEPEEAG
ncbi:MAG TPA: hypothetical protein VM695_14855 [Phycisphaerae bacterium]|nr:hypothetical protein [Phycisphaerae bacterium]